MYDPGESIQILISKKTAIDCIAEKEGVNVPSFFVFWGRFYQLRLRILLRYNSAKSEV